MKNFQKITLFTAILFAFLFLANQKTEIVTEIQTELPGHYGQEGLHTLAFLQPETTHQVVSHEKTNTFAVAKWIDAAEVFSTCSGANQIRKSFFTQDINRCEAVSLLLFPFHIFW